VHFFSTWPDSTLSLRKALKKGKTDADEKKKENNAADTEEDTEAFKLAHHWKSGSKLNSDTQYKHLIITLCSTAVILYEIHHYQKSTDFLIAKLFF